MLYGTHTIEQGARVEEILGLAQAIELDILFVKSINLSHPKPAQLFGKGTVDDILQQVNAQDIELIIVDHDLTPVQQRNLERAWQVKIIDRTGLILEIFGRRARTKEGRLQVDLAHLTYQKSRLVRSWTHLERQRGGGGFMGGPGETQIEADRRLIQTRILSLTKELEKVKKTRLLHRNARNKTPFPMIALVGYTNAGKSTLFNKLTGANVIAEDQLFATLDPTMRQIESLKGRKAILSDTVGFISNLPTQLVAAFRATLEEVRAADIILHVMDISNPDYERQKNDVLQILKDLDIDSDDTDKTLLNIWNKVDLLPADQQREMRNKSNGGGDYKTNKSELNEADSLLHQENFILSAQTGAGIAALLAAIEAHLNSAMTQLDIYLAPHQGKLINWLHNNAVIERVEHVDNGDIKYGIKISDCKMGKLQSMLKKHV